jgi:hypothetical protein
MQVCSGGFQSYALSTNSLAGGPSNDFLPGRIPIINRLPFLWSRLLRWREFWIWTRMPLFYMYGVNLINLFFVSRLVMVICTTYWDYCKINFIIGDWCNHLNVNFCRPFRQWRQSGWYPWFCVALFASWLMGLMGLNAERSASIWRGNG